MAFQAGSKYYFAFYAGVSGLTTSDFSLSIFTKDGVAVDSATRSTFSVTAVGSGYYYAQYVPSVGGLYYLALVNVAHFLNIANAIEIDDAPNVSNLTQDTGGTNALKPVVPSIKPAGLKAPPAVNEYILMVFQSSDWQVGRVDNTYAVAMTELDIHGNWLTTPLVVVPGTYHIIIRNRYGTTKVIKPFLEV